MDSFLSVQPGLLIWSTINFLLFLVVLYLIGGKNFIRNITNREHLIQDAINTAESQKTAMERLVAENEQKMLDAQKNVNEALRHAREQAQLQAELIINEAKQSGQNIVNEAKAEIERNKKLALQEIRSEVADLVMFATEKIIEEKLDQEKDKVLINKYLDQIQIN